MPLAMNPATGIAASTTMRARTEMRVMMRASDKVIAAAAFQNKGQNGRHYRQQKRAEMVKNVANSGDSLNLAWNFIAVAICALHIRIRFLNLDRRDAPSRSPPHRRPQPRTPGACRDRGGRGAPVGR